ncbi:hypothetical protein ACFSMW_05520 [Virgibacillus halophilus]|uniref:ComG operon protein 7 n=1 Tax=Tigheibacillus halophilus TaxID=361280 RepID=A0ABU5CBH4_9BACI|nr:hypothetical protein [Virgibacillus halophilus]
MKKSFSFITDRQGFIFPYVMFIIAIVLLLVTTSSNMYKNEIHIAKQFTDNLQMNTVYQMGFAKFKEEYVGNLMNADSDKVDYEFPPGHVAIHYSESDEQIKLDMKITLKGGSAKRTIKRTWDPIQ